VSEQPDIETLKEILASASDWRKRREALLELRQIGGDEVKEAIANALLDENPHVGEYAAQSLVDFGSSVVPQLTSALDHADERVLPSILYTLEEIGDASALPAIEKLIEHPYPRVSGFALCAFCKLAPHEQAVPYLLRGLQSELTGLQDRCAEIITPLHIEEAVPHLLKIVLSSGSHVMSDAGSSAAIALGRLGNAGLEALLEASRHIDDKVRRNAARGLGESNDPGALERLAELLHDEDSLSVADAIQSLSKLNHPGTYELLLPLLDGPKVPRNLFHALGQTGDLQAVPMLMEQLRKGRDGSTGLRILGEEHWGIEPLERDMTHIPEVMAAARNDPDKHVRILAIWVLSSIGSRYEHLRTSWLRTNETTEGLEVPEVYLEARDLVIELLHNKDADIRLSAIHVLSTLGDQHVLVEIAKHLWDRDYLIARKAISLVTKIARSEHCDLSPLVPTYINLLEMRKHPLRASAIFALGRIANEASITALLKLLADEEDPHRKIVIRALSSGTPDRIVPALLALLDDEISPKLRAAVVFSLSMCQHGLKTNDKRILETMIRVLNDLGPDPGETYDARSQASTSLLLMRDEGSIPAMMHAIDHAPEWQIRMYAVETLGKIGSHRDAAERLYPLLEHRDSLIRTVAADSLGYIGADADDEPLRDEIVKKLIPKLDDEGKGYMLRPSVTFAAGRSLYFIGTNRALDALKEREAYERKQVTRDKPKEEQ